jgi:sulfur-carrier protein
MMVRFYATLRPLVGGKHIELDVAPGETVGGVLARLVDRYPALEGELLTPDRQTLLAYVQVFVSGLSIRDLEGLATVLHNPKDMAVFPPVAGG